MREKKELCSDKAFAAMLSTACKGLLFPSETDAPIEPFFDGKAAGGIRAALCENLSLQKNVPLEERSFGQTFARLTKQQEWFATAESRVARRFGRLEKLLSENLRGLTVLRVGHIQIDVFIVGEDAAGCIAGVRTKAVET